MKRPFEVQPEYLQENLEKMVDLTFADLQSKFLFVPKGDNFIEYSAFQSAYEVLKRHTSAFYQFNEQTIWNALIENSLVLTVLRAILGLTPPEWVELAQIHYNVRFDGRQLESKCRKLNKRTQKYDYIARNKVEETRNRIQAMILTAVKHIEQGPTIIDTETIHRFNKVDTLEGLDSLRYTADQHVPYAMLLYERFLGRPFASHKDSVSSLVGDVMENAVEEILMAKKITYRKTKRVERVPNFDQAPDFIIPDEYNPVVVIEAKITSDGGTARDKVTRIIHLCEMSDQRIREGKSGFEVVACIDGRGFGERREDMKKILQKTNGKVFTTSTLEELISYTQIKSYLPKNL